MKYIFIFEIKNHYISNDLQTQELSRNNTEFEFS